MEKTFEKKIREIELFETARIGKLAGETKKFTDSEAVREYFAFKKNYV